MESGIGKIFSFFPRFNKGDSLNSIHSYDEADKQTDAHSSLINPHVNQPVNSSLLSPLATKTCKNPKQGYEDPVVVNESLESSTNKNDTIANDESVFDIGRYVSNLPAICDLTRFKLLTEPWQPPVGFKFPFSSHNKQRKVEKRYFQRHFQRQRESYTWLVFSPSTNGLFCKFCSLFARDIGTINLNSLVKVPLESFAKLTGNDGALSLQETRKYHQNTVLLAEDFMTRYKNADKEIINQVNSHRLSLIKENRERLRSIILCGQQNLALRGHRDDGSGIKKYK